MTSHLLAVRSSLLAARRRPKVWPTEISEVIETWDARIDVSPQLLLKAKAGNVATDFAKEGDPQIALLMGRANTNGQAKKLVCESFLIPNPSPLS